MRATELETMLRDARRRTLELVCDLTEAQMRVPLLAIINPPVWEIGHVAWFQEKWVLRHLLGKDPIRPDGDAIWDSAVIAHDDRWSTLPRSATLRYMQEIFDRVIDSLPQGDVADSEAYFYWYWLAVMHEDMHGEALMYTRQTLGYPEPELALEGTAGLGQETGGGWDGPEAEGDVFMPGGLFQLGAKPGKTFVFDNEKWAHAVKVQSFAISRTPVTNRQFAEFVNDGGYRRRGLWSEEGWSWREKAQAEHPVYWIPQTGGRWMRRHFDQIVPLGEDLPVIHVNWYEAEAYCAWAKRRLPAEAEWEMAASCESPSSGKKREFPWGDERPTAERAHLDARTLGCVPASDLAAGDSAAGVRQLIGNVWEWTASDFQPYPGFVVDPYKEYSQPWFGAGRKVLRGGCWATRSRLIRNTWRNFYTKDRRDVFAGFRTCAAD
ncbi:MAG TPA: selenoneine synthase SenA [Bryobacterales bacterium]|jgi:iron(II)-dependent oxidoreductase|nr:selenoneine synthase SenA [Bryobacterales bacterium]